MSNSQAVTQGVTPSAVGIALFCRQHGISRTTFYKLLAEGTAPKVIRVGRRVLVSAEAAAEWRRGLEQRSAP